MNDLYWVGLRETEIEYCKELFTNSITICGEKNINLENKSNIKIDYNNPKYFKIIDNFLNNEVLSIIQANSNAKFMYYSQIYSYKSIQKLGILDKILCLNDQKLVELISNKFAFKELIKDIVPILPYEILEGKYCTFNKLSNKYGNQKSFVAQMRNSSGGSGTFLLNESNQVNDDILNNEKYMITKYCENNIPINIHVLVKNEGIDVLPGSIQKIDLSHNKLKYVNCNFDEYMNIEDNLREKAIEYAFKIGTFLKQMGYKGICGIDSIIYEKEIYFMEVNARFQNSSTYLNKKLKEKNLPSLQKMVLDSFKLGI